MRVTLFPNSIQRRPMQDVDISYFLNGLEKMICNVPQWVFEPRENRQPLIDPTYKEDLFEMLDGKPLLQAQENIRQHVRENGKTPLIGQAKRLLPGATISARFPERRTKESPHELTGIIAIDVDKCDPQAAKKVLYDTGIFFYIGLSVTGTGVFALVEVEEPECHLEHFESIRQEVNPLLQELGTEVDYLPDITRLRYFSHDQEAIWAEPRKYTRKTVVYDKDSHADVEMLESRGATTDFDKPIYAEKCLAKAEMRGIYYTPEGGLNPYLVKVLPYFNMYGLSPTYTAEFLWSKLSVRDDFDTNHYPYNRVKGDVDHFYEVYKSQHHVLELPRKIVNVELPHTDREYELQRDQKLSDLGIELKSLSILQSAPGTGKSYFAIHSADKMDMVMPTQELAKQAASEYGVNVVMQGSNVNQDNIQVGTYNAIEKFRSRNTKDRTLFVDEAHSLITGASKGFRNEVVNTLVDSFKMYPRVVLMTGTWIENLHPELRNFYRIKVHSRGAEKPYKIVRYEDRLRTLRARLTPKKLNVVYLNDKVKAQEYAEFLDSKGWKCQLFNSSTKKQEMHREIIEQQRVGHGVEVLFVTSLYIEGLNLYNRNMATLHIMTRATEEIIEQIANRTRKKAPDITYVYVSTDSDIHQDVQFDFLQYQADLLSEAHEIVEHSEHFKRFGFHDNRLVFAQKIIESMQFERRNMIRVRNNNFEVDYLGAAYVALMEKQVRIFQNIELFEDGMKRYGWTRLKDDLDLTSLSVQDDQMRKELHQQARDEKIENFKEMVESLLNYTEEDIELLYRKGVENRDLELVLEWLHDLNGLVPIQDAIRLVSDTEGSKGAMSLLRKQLVVQKYLQTDQIQENEDTRTIDKIIGEFAIGKAYSNDEIRDKITGIITSNPKLKTVKLSSNKATKVLKMIFEVARTTARTDDGKTKGAYRILSTNPIGLQIRKPEQPELQEEKVEPIQTNLFA